MPDTIDLSDVPDQPEFEVIPQGTYDGTVDSIEYARSQRTSDPMLTWFLRVHIHEQEGDRDVPMRLYTSFGERAISRTKRQLQALAPELDLATFRPSQADEIFGGMSVRVRVRVQNNPPTHDYPGRRNNVQSLLPAAEAFVNG
jgi:hypothetical protein